MRKVKTAMLLAAGLGTRLRPLTDTVPKPLVRAAGQSLLQRGLAMLAAAGVERTVINAHYRARQLIAAADALRSAVRPMELLISDESDGLLDSAGGVIKALPLLGAEPFFILNADSFWREPPGGGNNWRRLAAAFDPAAQDMLLLTVPRLLSLVPQKGDFLPLSRPGGKARPGGAAAFPLVRAGGRAEEAAALIYAGGMIVRPAVFAAAAKAKPPEPQSLNLYFDKALAKQRLYGLKLAGQWFSIGSAAELAAAEALLKADAPAGGQD